MLVDANILLFAVDATSPWHEQAASWLAQALNGQRRVGLPWLSLGAFVRISTHPRAVDRPLSTDVAWGHVEDWLAAGPAWIPGPTARHAEVLGEILTTHRISGNLVTDAQLAAIAVEHGLTIFSADTDFARFKEIRWENPLRA